MICTSRADVRKEGARIVRTDANRTDWSFWKKVKCSTAQIATIAP